MIAKKRLSLKALAGEVSQIQQEIAGRKSLHAHVQPQMLRVSNEESVHKKEHSTKERTERLEDQVHEQAKELEAENNEIDFLKKTISASSEVLPAGADAISQIGKRLQAAGYTGSAAEQARIKSEQQTLEHGWRELDQRRAEREESARSEAAELSAISKRLKDLEDLEEEDRVGSRKGEHEERLRVLRGLADSLGAGRGRGGSKQQPKLDFRPPPYPHPPGHGRPAQGAGDDHGDGDDQHVQNMKMEDERLYYNQDKEGEKGREAAREERWGKYRRLRRDTLARGAFGGAGRVGDGVHVVHAEERGEMTSAADMRISLPAVFPSDFQRSA